MRAPLSSLPIVFDAVSVTAAGTHMLHAVSATLRPGAPTAVLGPNGAGKTTLLRLAMGLMPPSRGSVSWGGRGEPGGAGCAIVFQRPAMLRRSVSANVAFALPRSGLTRGERRDRLAHLLELTALTALAHRPARQLSGGEQQRVALARALARAPEVLLLDEPTNSLDPAATRSVEAIIAQAAASGIKVVMATHDLGQARRLAGNVLFLVDGRLIEQAPAPDFFVTPASEKAAAFLRGDIVE
jgi:tungstate transport system ATP-binding protein